MPDGIPVLVAMAALGAVLGAAVALVLARARTAAAVRLARAEAAAGTAAATARAEGLETRLAEGRAREAAAAGEADVLRERLGTSESKVAELEARLAAAAEAHAENLARLQGMVAEADKRLADQFKAVAAQILDEKTAKFTETNRARLDELLTPLRERLAEFQKKVEDTHVAEMQGQSLLKGELDRLVRLNQQVSTEAHNLTVALKGESKTQGNWGELILERALEMSGLEAGREYRLQDIRQTEAGDRRQPDVVVTLPDERYLIIDAKVSLVAYERYANAADDAARDAALSEHLASLRGHIRALGDKDYPQLYGVAAVDFVLLFVPLEPALMVALRADPGLYETALQKNVVLVAPSSLLATLRVVKQVWQMERQNRNVEQIAKLGGFLYDSVVRFSEELLKVQKAMDTAGQSVNEALRLLTSGGTSVVRRAERLRQLGVKATKRLPKALADPDADPEAGVDDAGDGASEADEPTVAPGAAEGSADRPH
jgi:DNA recombination protein RmuC